MEFVDVGAAVRRSHLQVSAHIQLAGVQVSLGIGELQVLICLDIQLSLQAIAHHGEVLAGGDEGIALGIGSQRAAYLHIHRIFIAAYAALGHIQLGIPAGGDIQPVGVGIGVHQISLRYAEADVSVIGAADLIHAHVSVALGDLYISGGSGGKAGGNIVLPDADGGEVHVKAHFQLAGLRIAGDGPAAAVCGHIIRHHIFSARRVGGHAADIGHGVLYPILLVCGEIQDASVGSGGGELYHAAGDIGLVSAHTLYIRCS